MLDWPIGLRAIVRALDSFLVCHLRNSARAVHFVLTSCAGTHFGGFALPYNPGLSRVLSAIKAVVQCDLLRGFFSINSKTDPSLSCSSFLFQAL